MHDPSASYEWPLAFYHEVSVACFVDFELLVAQRQVDPIFALR